MPRGEQAQPRGSAHPQSTHWMWKEIWAHVYKVPHIPNAKMTNDGFYLIDFFFTDVLFVILAQEKEEQVKLFVFSLLRYDFITSTKNTGLLC